MLGLRHSHDPNLAIFFRENDTSADNTAQPTIQLVTTKPVAEGDHMSCSHNGYNQLLHVFQRGREDYAPAVERALAELLQAGKQLEQIHFASDIQSPKVTACHDFVRARYHTLATTAGIEHWTTQVGRVLLLQHGVDW